MQTFLGLAAAMLGLLLEYIVMLNMKKKKLSEAQAVSWLSAGILIIILGIFPGLIPFFAHLLNIEYAPTVVFVLAIAVLLFIVFYHTTNISLLVSQVNELAMQVALLQEENEELKNAMSKMQGKADRKNGHRGSYDKSKTEKEKSNSEKNHKIKKNNQSTGKHSDQKDRRETE